ncbi:type II secretion system F family protein [Streptomyces sp. B1866]|uniref:type II secretion system F family protein n=1 Tax=Streptomyces sp. B1866 TaxID=3075431 RepID=UPI00288C99CB|nr:type II secretion system F family protein [Streptomyces sp. B1866]MDT3395164.1 type II secretion system F family protein [Streptomyces sp. B1866]
MGETAGQGLPLGAALCAGAAAWVLAGRGHDPRRARLLLAGGAGVEPPGSARLRRLAEAVLAVRERWRVRYGGRLGRELLCLPAGLVVALLGASPLPLLAAAVAVPLVGRRLRTRHAARERARRAAAVIELCGAVAGELRAGRQPGEALLAAPSGDLGERWGLVSAAARFGGDVPDALRRAARVPGVEGLTGVAACWQVAVDEGAGLAVGLDRVAAALRAERDREEDLRAQLATPRVTAAVLLVLPVFGLLMGGALGAGPLRVLLHTPAGLACLLVGGSLAWAGFAWTTRVVRAAVRPGGKEGRPDER